jgi:very-short-patch-repair endonuclease
MRQISENKSQLPRRTVSMRRRVAASKKEMAAHLRASPTAAYEKLWQQLRSRKLGVKFRRRAVLYGWILDFWCPSERLAVEIDYASDKARFEEHRHRDSILAQHAIHVVRIPAERIYLASAQVIRELQQYLGAAHNKRLVATGVSVAPSSCVGTPAPQP